MEVRLSGSSPAHLIPPSRPKPWPLRSAHIGTVPPPLLQAIVTGSALAICDGSYMPHQYPHLAVAAWILHSGSELAFTCHGITQVHGQPTVINSFRVELQGMHALLLALMHICSTNGLSAGHVSIGCNNKGVLSLVQWPRAYVSCSLKHHDLLRAIVNTRCSCPLSLSFHYIAGHQDDLARFEDLPLLAQLNVQADSLAKQALHILGTQQTPPILTPLPSTGWTLSIKDLLVSSDPQPLLLDHLSYRSAIPYWIKRGQLTDYSASLID